MQHDEYGLEVVGAIDDDPKFSSADLGAPLLGDVSDLSTLVRATKSEVLIVAYSFGDQRSLVDSLRDAMAEGAKIWVVPRLFGLRGGGPRGDYIWGLPVLPLKSPAAYRPQWALKRLFDLALTVLGVLVLSPVLLLIAAAIYFDLGRPILYRQRRITRGGRSFEMLKFRTMRLTERHVETTQGVRFMMSNSRVLNQNWLNDGVAVDQSRMTRLGIFLRSSSLDELPQLLNVLKGDMSLVGPRPERPHFAKVLPEDLYPWSTRPPPLAPKAPCRPMN